MARFTINANLKISVDIDISADSLEDALEQARTLKVTDFIEFKGDWNDGEEPHIIGVFEN